MIQLELHILYNAPVEQNQLRLNPAPYQCLSAHDQMLHLCQSAISVVFQKSHIAKQVIGVRFILRTLDG